MQDTFNLDGIPSFIGGPTVKISGLKVLSILFGKNGSGKSLLLRRISELNHDNTHYCNPEKSGTFAYNAHLFEGELSGSKRLSGRRENINPSYYEQVITRIQSFLVKRGAWVDGISPISHLDIANLIHLLLPDYQITIKTESPYIEVKNQYEDMINLNTLSSGERHILGLGLDIASICAIWKLENRNENVLLIDEPDAHLHPDLHQNFALFIKTTIEKFSVQIIIATHSTTLLAALGHYL